MATPQDDLTAKLKALGNKPTPSFVASETNEPIKTSSIHTEQMKNLIDTAAKSNAKIMEAKVFDKTPVFKSKSLQVMQILKDNGMDSQQCEKACAQLMKLES